MDSFEQRLQQKYPIITKRLTMVECGPGWNSIVERLCAALEKCAQKTVDDESPLCIEQLKSKFGELRCYTNWVNEEADEIIRQAEVEASYTCESCGAVESTLRTDIGWITVLCPSCHEKTKEIIRARSQQN